MVNYSRTFFKVTTYWLFCRSVSLEYKMECKRNKNPSIYRSIDLVKYFDHRSFLPSIAFCFPFFPFFICLHFFDYRKVTFHYLDLLEYILSRAVVTSFIGKCFNWIQTFLYIAALSYGNRYNDLTVLIYLCFLVVSAGDSNSF